MAKCRACNGSGFNDDRNDPLNIGESRCQDCGGSGEVCDIPSNFATGALPPPGMAWMVNRTVDEIDAIKLLRQQLGQVREQLKINDEEQGALRVKEYYLSEHKDRLARQIILEEKILAGTEWELVLSSDGKEIYLDYHGSFDSAPINIIKELCWNGWHSSFELDPNFAHRTETDDYKPSMYDIHFDDTRVSIWFDNPKVIASFIQKYQIKLISNDLPKAIASSKIELEILQDLQKIVQE